MERLNSILGRTMPKQHQQQAESQLEPGNTGPGPRQGARQGSSLQHNTSQMPVTRRPLPEQRARLEKQYAAEGQPPAQRTLPPHAHLRNAQASRNRANPIDPYAQEERALPDYQQYQEMDPLPTTRPPYQPQQTVNAAPPSYPARMRPKQDMQRTHSMPALPPANANPYSYYHTDDHGPALPADVYEGEEDDDEGMLYGGYLDDEYSEEDEEMEDLPVYQRENFPPAPSQLPAPRGSYPQMTREMAALPQPEMRPRPTRDLRTHMNAQQAAQLQARTQEVQRYQRTTQPLDPQMVAEMYREREQAVAPQQLPPPQRSARQMTTREPSREHAREHSKVPVRLTPIPPAAVAPVAARSVCPRCRGAGYLRLDVPFGHPNFGKPIACECKEAERKEKRRQQLRAMSNLDAHHSQTFRTFNDRVPGVKEAFEVAKEYAQCPEGWLLMIGPNGSGKTHLAAAIANQSLDSGSVVLFSVVPDLLDHLRAAFAPNATEVYDQLFAKMREAEVLVLDDMGAQQSSPWANEKLFQLLNYRYNLGMPTVITANPRGLQGIDERIRSRLSDVSLVMTVNLDRARDYRPNHPRRRD